MAEFSEGLYSEEQREVFQRQYEQIMCFLAKKVHGEVTIKYVNGNSKVKEETYLDGEVLRKNY